MKQFLIKVTIFLIPVIFTPIFLNLIVPINFWSFRAWESLAKFKSRSSIGYFYPNQRIEMIERGDLANNTDYSVPKPVVWQTDKYGFRNESVPENIDIVISGDSFIAGTGLTQEDTIAPQLQKLTGKTTYQIASGDLNQFFLVLNNGLIKKPKVVVFSIVERNIETLKPLSENKPSQYIQLLANYPILSEVLTYGDRLAKDAAQKKLHKFVMSQPTELTQSPIEEDMFFFTGPRTRIDYTDELINEQADIIVGYRDLLESKGIDFIFLPTPNKETIYFDLVPFSTQPTLLQRLDNVLKQKGVKSINTVELFTKQRENILLYHTDDTHWTPEAVTLTAQEIQKQLNE